MDRIQIFLWDVSLRPSFGFLCSLLGSFSAWASATWTPSLFLTLKMFRSCFGHQASCLSLIFYASLLILGYAALLREASLDPRAPVPQPSPGKLKSHCPSVVQLPQPEAVFKLVLPLGLDSQGMAPGKTYQVLVPFKGLSPLWSWVCFIGGGKKRGGKTKGLDCWEAWSQPRLETAPPPRVSRLSASKNSLCLWANVPRWGLS